MCANIYMYRVEAIYKTFIDLLTEVIRKDTFSAARLVKDKIVARLPYDTLEVYLDNEKLDIENVYDDIYVLKHDGEDNIMQISDGPLYIERDPYIMPQFKIENSVISDDGRLQSLVGIPGQYLMYLLMNNGPHTLNIYMLGDRVIYSLNDDIAVNTVITSVEDNSGIPQYQDTPPNLLLCGEYVNVNGKKVKADTPFKYRHTFRSDGCVIDQIIAPTFINKGYLLIYSVVAASSDDMLGKYIVLADNKPIHSWNDVVAANKLTICKFLVLTLTLEIDNPFKKS